MKDFAKKLALIKKLKKLVDECHEAAIKESPTNHEESNKKLAEVLKTTKEIEKE